MCPADILLLSGSAVVNEAMLTGESTPLMKESLTIEKDDLKGVRLDIKGRHRNSAVFAGTTIVQFAVEKEKVRVKKAV